MSFYSSLEIWAPRPVDLRRLERQIKIKLDGAGLSHDVFLDLHDAFSSGRSLVKIILWRCSTSSNTFTRSNRIWSSVLEVARRNRWKKRQSSRG